MLLFVSVLLAVSALILAGYDQFRDTRAGILSQDLVDRFDQLPDAPETLNDPAKLSDGEAYIGILSIPKLSLTLPINREWSLTSSDASPCRYRGSILGKDLIIAGHNYSSHFGDLYRLEPGDTLSLTDAVGIVHSYAVTESLTLSGSDVAAMEEGDWDLTLFTCTYGGQNRITVRCREQN